MEEFSKQSDEVKEEFKSWLEENLQEKDWVRLIEERTDLWVDSVLDTRKDKINVGRVFYLGKSLCWSSIHDPNIVPLLQMDQLMQFIQEKGYKFISLNNYIEVDKKQMWTAKAFKTMMQLQPSFETFEEDKLKALWEVAIEIAECQ